ncbi:XdhC family protein [Neorhizobium sp. NPDC001467]|uniref:XdhC family protein n=1 Tax=Neorhizobium sp. NPDC001467 TaxID=3390595 RepID=UPI003D00D069
MNSISAQREPLVPAAAFETDDPLMLLEFLRASLADGVPAALVTLVEVRGGSARPVGAQMVVRADGFYCGFVSGGCTEAAIAGEALQALESGQDRFLKLGEGSPFFDIVLPCGGGITLSIHVVSSLCPINDVLARLAARQPAALCYDPGRKILAAIDDADVTGWHGDTFVTIYLPKTRLLVLGRSLEVSIMSRLAEAAGYDVIVADDGVSRPKIDHNLDRNSAVALLYHDLDRELPLLRAALDASPFYIGALGSQRTHERRCEALRDLGYGEADIARIKAPIGIFGKARDATSLAISVLADIASSRKGM